MEKIKVRNKYINFKEVPMETSNLKNMVILKNLPSNLVEEAIVILKPNKKVKNLEIIEKNKKTAQEKSNQKEKDYILKEAEMLVNNYINQIEEKKEKEGERIKLGKKYKKIKRYACIITTISILQFVILLIQ